MLGNFLAASRISRNFFRFEFTFLHSEAIPLLSSNSEISEQLLVLKLAFLQYFTRLSGQLMNFLWKRSEFPLPPSVISFWKLYYTDSSHEQPLRFCAPRAFFRRVPWQHGRIYFKVNKKTLTPALSRACLEIRSRNEEAINSTRNMIYSLKVFTSYFIDFDAFYLFLNWFSTCANDDQKYLCGRRLYACISTRKFIGLDSRDIIYIIARYQKSDLHGTSFQSPPKINCMLITRPFASNESLQHPQALGQHPTVAILLIKILIFFDHSVMFTCSKVINAFKR